MICTRFQVTARLTVEPSGTALWVLRALLSQHPSGGTACEALYTDARI